MKKLVTLLSLIFITTISSHAQTTFYTCATPSGTNVSTDPAGANPCTVPLATWNAAGNLLIVRAGTTLNFPGPFTGSVRVFGTIVLSTANATTVIETTSRIVVENGGLITFGGNRTVVINPGGVLIIKAGGALTGTGSSDLVVNGSINGNGSVSAGGDITGGGTINGTTAPFPNPIDLNTLGFTWNGTTWSPSVPNGTEDNAIFTGNWTEGVSTAFTAGSINIGAATTVTFNNSFRANIVSILDNGTLVLIDNATLNENLVAIEGTGSVQMVRNFPANSGWNHMGWPVRSVATVANLVSTGFNLNLTNPPSNQTNVFYWDAATAGWLVPTATTPLAGKALNIYTFNTGNSISLTVPVPFFNNLPLSQPYTYFNPGAVPPGNATGWSNATTDGWNMWVNPYQQDLNPDVLALPVSLNNAVYAWNGSGYSSRVATVGALTGLSVNQAFFVRTPASNGSHSIPLAARTTVSAPSFFKKGDIVELTLAGEGYSNSTFIYEQSNATVGFDSDFDAFYFSHTGNAPHFNSVGVDSTAYSVQALPQLNLSEQYLTFYYGTNAKSFTISVDLAQIPSLTSLMLHDLHTGTNTDLLQGDYTFTSTTAAPAQRFKLTFAGGSVGMEEASESTPLVAWFTGNELQLNSIEVENIANITITNMAGQVVAKGNGQSALLVNQSGVYVVAVTTKTGSQKVLKVVKL